MTNAGDPVLGCELPAAIGSYRVERSLFAGGFYADYAAVHATLGHALTFRCERWPSRPEWRERPEALDALRRARRLQAELRHPRIVPVVDFFASGGRWFTVFDHEPEAPTLATPLAAIRNGELPPPDIEHFVRWSAALTDGLAALHRAGYVHRTLGPETVLLGAEGDLRLADLGCATPIDGDDPASRAFRDFGRLYSASPEQYDEESSFTPAVDCWALGVMLFELRYGRHPYIDGRALPALLAAALREGAIRFPEASADRQDDGLRDWLARLLAKDPGVRYADALAAQRDLEAVARDLEGRPPLARAFVAMPFATGFDDLWRAVHAACSACRVALVRADRSHRHDDVWQEIRAAIEAADLVLAVASPSAAGAFNPNVMIEVGYARALDKPLLLLTEDAEKLPFDLRLQRALTYVAADVGSGHFHAELMTRVQGMLAHRLAGPSPSG
ncbi:MAG: protein kinase [Planctomycetes bacterium]|nr:protein kinase [Planctomycetota bacterium]